MKTTIVAVLVLFLFACKSSEYTPQDVGVTTPSLSWTDSTVCIHGQVYSKVRVQEFLNNLAKGLPAELGNLVLTLKKTDTGFPILDFDYCYKHK